MSPFQPMLVIFLLYWKLYSTDHLKQVKGSRFLKPAHQLLEELCDVGRGIFADKIAVDSSLLEPPLETLSGNEVDDDSSLNCSDGVEQTRKKSRLLSMVDEANVHGPPSPGYYPSRRIVSTGFDHVCTNLWGPQHQTLDYQGALTIWLDNNTGSGFKSLSPYSSGYFGASIKLQSGYTAGVITSFYERDVSEESGWKLVHGDVFRPPQNLALLSAVVGTGAQLDRSISPSLIDFWKRSKYYTSQYPASRTRKL